MKTVKLTHEQIANVVRKTLKESEKMILSNLDIDNIVTAAAELHEQQRPIGTGTIEVIRDTTLSSGGSTKSKPGYNIIKIMKDDKQLVADIVHQPGKSLSPMESTKLVKGLSSLDEITQDNLEELLDFAEIKGINTEALLKIVS